MPEPLIHEPTHVRMIQIADGRDDQILRRVRVAEVRTERLGRERFDGLARAQDGTPEWMVFPEPLREDLVDEIVRRVLDHLDLFDHDFLLTLDVLGIERRIEDDVGEDVESQRQMLVEHLDVIARCCSDLSCFPINLN
ncbi:MAG: hypothetical protein QM736_12745, partial [Vicinamibacterales bacterium]